MSVEPKPMQMNEQNIPKRMVIFFAHVRSQGITEHICNMALAIGKHADLVVVYDKRIESGNGYLEKLKSKYIGYIDVSELKRVVDTRFNKVPLLFHCQGFSHLRRAIRIARPIDKVMMSVHGFGNAKWIGRWMALLSYLLYFRSVGLWHFVSGRSREEYFWYKKIPSNRCVFPLEG